MVNVLIVSADADYRDIYTLGLRHAGFGTRSAERCDHVPDIVRTFRVDAITLHMDRDTEAAWTECRSLIEIAHPAPVVLLTSWIFPDARNARMAFEIGCAAFVMEPCVPGDLADVIERVVAGERNVEWPVTRITMVDDG